VSVCLYVFLYVCVPVCMSVCVCLDTKWRNPDLREVIDYLSHEDDLIKANAAAYLQHLTYMDDNIKAETRSTACLCCVQLSLCLSACMCEWVSVCVKGLKGV